MAVFTCSVFSWLIVFTAFFAGLAFWGGVACNSTGTISGGGGGAGGGGGVTSFTNSEGGGAGTTSVISGIGGGGGAAVFLLLLLCALRLAAISKASGTRMIFFIF